MNKAHSAEINANLQRAQEAIQAAKVLVVNGHYDAVASRAYYATFYAATALLLHHGFAFKKHTAVIATIHREFIKTQVLDIKHGKNLNWLFELRSVGDYGVMTHVSQQDAEEAIQIAEEFLQAITNLLSD